MKQFDFRSAPLLLIGRDSDMLALLREVLIEAGFFVVARLSDSFLLNLDNSEDRPALIIYDEASPEVDAERIFYLLQDSSHWRDTPFMIISDHFEGTRVARCLDRGVAEFVIKPFDVDELAARVRKLLREVMEEAAAEAAQKHQPSPEGFAGDLAYMNLPDLLINLHQNMRTGSLVVQMTEGEYTFDLDNGKLVEVSGPQEISGRKALYRAIRKFYGTFVFNPAEDAPEGSGHEYGELPNLILSAVQEADEFPLTRNQLPGEGVLVELADGDRAEEVFQGDFRILRPLLQSEDKRSTIDDLILASHKTDLEAAQELLDFYQRDLIVEAA